MASILTPHLATILKMRKQQINFNQIAAHLTANGVKTSRQSLIKFYKKAVKNAVKIKREVADLESLLEDPKPIKKESTTEKQVTKTQDNQADYRPIVEGSDDPWKPKIVRPTAGWKPKPKEEPKSDPADDFKIGPDVLR